MRNNGAAGGGLGVTTECTFAPNLVTAYPMSPEVRAAQSNSDWRSVRWFLQPCGFERRLAPCHARAMPCQAHIVQLSGSNVALMPHHATRHVHVVQVGGSNVFERLAPTVEKLTSTKSAREEQRETRELDGATFKPQRLSAASDVSRRTQSDSPLGLDKHVARMVPATATMRNDGAAGGGLGATTECTFAPKLVTAYALSPEVRAAQSSSDWRSVRWFLRPCGVERRPTPRRARATPRQVHVVQIGGST